MPDKIQTSMAGTQDEMFQPAGRLPPVSMNPKDMGQPLEKQVARRTAEANAVGESGPEAWSDPMQAYGMLKDYLRMAKQEKDPKAAAYYQEQINQVMQAHDAQTARLLYMLAHHESAAPPAAGAKK